jgi:lipopolysaccharide exporter
LKKYFSSYWIRSAFYSFLQRSSIIFFGFIIFLELIRGLTKAQMGTWALFLIVTTIFETTKSFLLKNAHIKYVSTSDEGLEKAVIASSSFIINATISAAFILFILFFSDNLSRWLHAGTDLSNMLKWFIPGLICMVFFSHLEAIQQSHLDFKGVFAGYFTRQVVMFSIIFTQRLLNIPIELTSLALYQSISIFLGTLLLYYYSRPYLLYKFIPSMVWIKKIVGYGGYIFGSGIVVNIFANIDQIMTAKFSSGSAFVASYNAANRINTLVDIPSYAAAEILFPKVSRAAGEEEGKGKVKYMYERMVGILLSFTVPAALIIICLPGLIISLIAGSQYAESAPILQLYMIAGILRPAQNQAANLMTSVGKPKLVFIMNALFLVTNLGINYICLIKFGFYGAAIGSVITCYLGMIAWYMVMRRQISLQINNVFKYMIDTYRAIYVEAVSILAKTKQVHV